MQCGYSSGNPENPPVCDPERDAHPRDEGPAGLQCHVSTRNCMPCGVEAPARPAHSGGNDRAAALGENLQFAARPPLSPILEFPSDVPFFGSASAISGSRSLNKLCTRLL